MDFPIDGVNDIFAKITLGFKHFQFGAKAQLAFLEDLYVLVNDGIPPNRAIDMMTQVTSGISSEVAQSLSQKIAEGQALAEGMREWFSTNIVEIIHVGEEGGALAETMKSAINTLGQSNNAFGAFFTAISYPLLVIIMACSIIIYLNGSVFVQFKLIKPMDLWPSAGRQLVAVADIIEYWWWIVVLAIIGTIFVVKRIMTNYIGELRPILDRIPPFSLYRKMAAARLMETLGLLVANGVVFKNAIKVMQFQANPYVANHLVMMEHRLSMGKGNVADVLTTGLIEEKDVLRLKVMGSQRLRTRISPHGSTRRRTIY